MKSFRFLFNSTLSRCAVSQLMNLSFVVQHDAVCSVCVWDGWTRHRSAERKERERGRDKGRRQRRVNTFISASPPVPLFTFFRLILIFSDAHDSVAILSGWLCLFERSLDGFVVVCILFLLHKNFLFSLSSHESTKIFKVKQIFLYFRVGAGLHTELGLWCHLIRLSALMMIWLYFFLIPGSFNLASKQNHGCYGNIIFIFRRVSLLFI